MEGFPKLMAVLFVLPDPSFVLPWLQSPKNQMSIQQWHPHAGIVQPALCSAGVFFAMRAPV